METYHHAPVAIAEVWGDPGVARDERGLAMTEGAVAFGQVFAEQRVDLRWPTLADQESVTVIAVMLLIAKGTP
jgi:hypothetical protein